jgi:hypothetical protein
MPFKPGQSGNPGGRAHMPEELKIKLRNEIPKVIDFWIKAYTDTSENFSNRNKAAENLIYYGYGKPKESVEVEHISEAVESHEETLRKIDELLARREAAKATGEG